MRLLARRSKGIDPHCTFVVRCVRDVAVPTEPVDPWSIASRPVQSGEPPPGALDPEAERRWREGTADIVLALASNDREAGPLVVIGMELADAFATEAEGVIVDPVAQRVVLPGEWRTEEHVYDVDPREHVTVHVVDDGDGLWVHTHGLLKFGRAELELYDLPRELQGAAWAFVLDIAGYTIDGPAIAPGNTVGAPEAPLRAHDGGRDREHWASTPVLELRGDGIQTADALTAWAA